MDRPYITLLPLLSPLLSVNLLANDDALLPEERAFFSQHPKLPVHNEVSGAPDDFYENGQPLFVAGDILGSGSSRHGAHS